MKTMLGELVKKNTLAIFISVGSIFFLLTSCTFLNKKNDTSRMMFEVEIDSEKKTWEVVFTEELSDSCHVSGTIKKGLSTELVTGEQQEIGYIFYPDKLIIDHSPGLCDGGYQTELVKINSLYKGSLFHRSFSGAKKIGTVNEIN